MNGKRQWIGMTMTKKQNKQLRGVGKSSREGWKETVDVLVACCCFSMVVPIVFFICLSTFFSPLYHEPTFAHIRSSPPPLFPLLPPFSFSNSSSPFSQISLVLSSLSPFNLPTHPSQTMDENKKRKKKKKPLNNSQFPAFPFVPPFPAYRPLLLYFCSLIPSLSASLGLSLSQFALLQNETRSPSRPFLSIGHKQQQTHRQTHK